MASGSGGITLRVCRFTEDQGTAFTFDDVPFQTAPTRKSAVLGGLLGHPEYSHVRPDHVKGLLLVPWDLRVEGDNPQVSSSNFGSYINLPNDFNTLNQSSKLIRYTNLDNVVVDISAQYATGLPHNARLVLVLPSPSTSGPSAGGAGIATRTPRSARSVTNIVAPIFEEEARTVFANAAPTVCVWADAIDTIRSRSLFVGTDHRQADVIAHTTGDNGRPCMSIPSDGIVTVLLADDAAADPEEAAHACRSAPLNPERIPRTENGSITSNMKYVLGEAYSGEDESTIKKKVKQLESLIGFTLRRFNDRYGTDVTDIIQIVGCAVLLFSVIHAKRSTVRSRHLCLVPAVLSSRVRLADGTVGDFRNPYLLRLVRARRLVLMTLSTVQALNAYCQRCFARALAGDLEITLPEWVEDEDSHDE